MGKDKRKIRLEYLAEQLGLAEKAAAVLRLSYHNIRNISPAARTFSDADLIQLDAATSRFARLSDILIQKIFRAVDAVELTDEGSLLDRLNRAEKRGLIDSAETWQDIRELRNQIAHEYVMEDLHSLFEDVVQLTPLMLRCVDDIQTYLESKALSNPDYS